MKKILFLTTDFPPARTVGTQRVTKILKYIDQEHFKFSVLTLDETAFKDKFNESSFLEKRLPRPLPIYRCAMKDLTLGFTSLKAIIKRSSRRKPTIGTVQAKEQPKGAKLKKLSVDFTKVVNIGRRLIFSILEFPDKHIGWIFSSVAEGVRIIKENNIDLILTTAPPHSLFIMAWLIKRKTGVKLVLDYRDPWALSRWDKGSAIKAQLESQLEKKIIKSADAVFFVTDKMYQAYVRAYPNDHPEKFHVFYNGYDADDFEGLQVEPQKGKPIRVVHLGSLYKKRNPEKLFIAVKNLKEKGQIKKGDICFEFIGFVATELSFLYDLIRQNGLDGFIEFKGNIAFHDSIRTMYAADALLIVQPFTDLQVPAKLLEYMYTRRPILALAEHDSATDMVIRDGRLGFTAASQDVAEIEQAIIDLLEHLKNPQFTPNETYIESFNMKNYIGKLEKILLEV